MLWIFRFVKCWYFFIILVRTFLIYALFLFNLFKIPHLKWLWISETQNSWNSVSFLLNFLFFFKTPFKYRYFLSNFRSPSRPKRASTHVLSNQTTFSVSLACALLVTIRMAWHLFLPSHWLKSDKCTSDSSIFSPVHGKCHTREVKKQRREHRNNKNFILYREQKHKSQAITLMQLSKSNNQCVPFYPTTMSFPSFFKICSAYASPCSGKRMHHKCCSHSL